MRLTDECKWRLWGCCPKWPRRLSKDLPGIRKGKLVYCGEVSVCLYQQFVVSSPAGRPFINAVDGTDRADLTTNQLLIDAAEVRGVCLLHTFVLPNTNIFYESVIKGKYYVKKRLQTFLWCSFFSALIEKLQPFPAPDLLEIFDPHWTRAFSRVTLLLSVKGSPLPSTDKGQTDSKRWSHWQVPVLLSTSPEMMEPQKLDFASKVGQLSTAAVSPACMIVTSTKCEMVPSMHWLAHMRSLIGTHVCLCFFFLFCSN